MTEIRNIGKAAMSLMQKDYLQTISDMTIEERALAYSEQVVNDTPFDVINGKVCVFGKKIKIYAS